MTVNFVDKNVNKKSSLNIRKIREFSDILELFVAYLWDYRIFTISKSI